MNQNSELQQEINFKIETSCESSKRNYCASLHSYEQNQIKSKSIQIIDENSSGQETNVRKDQFLGEVTFEHNYDEQESEIDLEGELLCALDTIKQLRWENHDLKSKLQ